MNTEKKHILVVEDDSSIQQLVSLYLHDSGYKVDFVGCGKEMYAFFKAGNTPHLVLLDLGLPDADGLELAEQIRAFSDVPIIILTARTQQTDKNAALGLGADDYLTKPFDPDELRLRIEKLLARSEPAEPCEEHVTSTPSIRVNLVGAIIAIIITVGLGLGLYTLMNQPVEVAVNHDAPERLMLNVSASCQDKDAVFTITNTGNRWLKPSEVRVYQVSSQTTVLRRRLLMAMNQSVTFKVKAGQGAVYSGRNFGGEGVGIWVKPGWYERAFKYDATVNCQ